MKTKQVHAKISQNGLIQIADFFNQNPKTTLGELLQNSRRAKATQVEITTMQTGTDVKVTITDNGEGIKNEETLIHLWESGWDDETKIQENPAGFGFFSLAHLPKGVTVKSHKWEMHIDQHVFAGKGPATSVPTKKFLDGTSLEFHLPNTNLAIVDAYVRDVCEFYPIPVKYNKRDVEQVGFLDEADFVADYSGVRVGVYHNSFYHNRNLRRENINFHGVTLNHTIPCPHPGWRIRIDVKDASTMDLVKPTRNHVIENQKWQDTLALVRKATYEACKNQEHRLPYRNWLEAKAIGIDIPEAKARLELAYPRNVYECGEVWSGDYAPNYPDEFDSNRPVPNKNSIIHHANDSDIAALHLSGKEIYLIFKPETAMEGYSWYPQIRITDLIQKIHYGKKVIKSATSAGRQWDKTVLKKINAGKTPDRITLEFKLVNNSTHTAETKEIETHIAFDVFDSGDTAVGNWVATQAGLEKINTSTLRALFFCPIEDQESDSYDTQVDWFEKCAESEIIRRTHGEAAEYLRTLQRAVEGWDVRSAMEKLGTKNFTVTMTENGVKVSVP